MCDTAKVREDVFGETEEEIPKRHQSFDRYTKIWKRLSRKTDEKKTQEEQNGKKNTSFPIFCFAFSKNKD